MTLELYIALYDELKQIISVGYIFSYDDSTMYDHLTHVGIVKNGKIPLDVPRSSFLCDPSHHIKVMVKDLFGLALSSREKI